MCFSAEMSGAFALLGLFCAWWVWHRTSNRGLAAGIFFFFVMEALQWVQVSRATPASCGGFCFLALASVAEAAVGLMGVASIRQRAAPRLAVM